MPHILPASRIFLSRALMRLFLCACALAFPIVATAGPPIVIPPTNVHASPFPFSPILYNPPYAPPRIIDVKGGDYYSLALDSDGTVWAWGYNYYGQLGNGLFQTFGIEGSATPARVHNLLGVTAIAAGAYHNLALKSDGTVWAWGDNELGGLGNGTFTNSITPVQVSGLSGAVAITAGWYHSLALKPDGTVWTWGWNDFGQLGNGTFTNTSSPQGIDAPVQVVGFGGNGYLTGVVAIEGGFQHSLALKSDGTVWTWGNDSYGELGNSTFNAFGIATPVQAVGLNGSGFLTGVTALAAGDYHSMALDFDGFIWAWGYNGDGELGNNTYNNSDTPALVIRLE